MIYVDKTQLNQVEYLIGQSILGNHVLFDIETLREIFSRRSAGSTPRNKTRRKKALDTSDAEGKTKDPEGKTVIEDHIEKMILQPSIAEKRAYLERLDSDTYENVVRTYFNIVENKLFEQLEAKH